ncbi:MAG TPA: alpha/beta hydrolase [Solirubrobacterales bacterium]|nr:alpha/beta hydrolase [Solirubrobacterales bacterium]
MSAAVDEVIASHRAAGRAFAAGGVQSFVREAGEGDPVLCLHGVPTSSFLYRKVNDELAARGLRGIAFDFPGLGLADRPEAFDYSWSGLARWSGEAIDALGIERCHLVVHDVGGPVGAEWAVRNPDRVLSMTVLNAPLNVATFRRPWSMHPFSIPRVGEIYLRAMTRPALVQLFRMQGIGNTEATPKAEVGAYYDLLKRADGGAAFLKIMRGFELTQAKQDFLWNGLEDHPYPAVVLWGKDDPALGMRYCRIACDVLGVEQPALVPAKHFLQEDQAPAIADAVAGLAAGAG